MIRRRENQLVLPLWSPSLQADQCIKHVITQIEHGDTPPPTLRTQLPDLPFLLREFSRFELRSNILACSPH